MKRQVPGQGPVSYIQVESVADHLTRIEEVGGKTIVPKTPVPGMGWFAYFMDTEGNTLALWETDRAAA